MQIVEAGCILLHGRLGSLLKEVLAKLLHEEVQDDVKLRHGALVCEGVQQSELLLGDGILDTYILSSFLSRATLLMIFEMGCVSGLVVAPPTPMDLGLILGSLFGTHLRSKYRLVFLPLVSKELFLAMKLLAASHNITEKLLVRHHVGFEV